MLTQLAKWGLSAEDAAALGMEEVTDWNEEGLKVPHGIRIPYYDPLRPGDPVVSLTGNPYNRFRVLPSPLAPPTADVAKGRAKYLQPPKTGVEAYFPLTSPWVALNEHHTAPVIITEGEAKAAKACKEGFPTIGLGGVNSFRNLAQGTILCRTLHDFSWRGRKTVIAYDSDVVSNPQVCKAVNALAESLFCYGARPFMVYIPDTGDGKVGLDDFLIQYGKDALQDLIRGAKPLGCVEALLRMNEQYAVIKRHSAIYDMKAKALLDRVRFCGVGQASARVMKYTATPEGIVHSIAKAGDEWLGWPMRTEFDELVYEPGEPDQWEDKINIWNGWGCKPVDGDPKPFLDLLDYMFGYEVKARKWFEQWLAYPIQFPGSKLYTAAVLYSVEHGTGKSFLGEIMGFLYGSNYGEIQQGDFDKDFNAWQKHKQFVLGDEVTSGVERSATDRLKRMITAKELRINEKYQVEYVIKDCINYLFTTNHPDAFVMEDTDRRFFVWEITNPKLSDDFYDRLHEWIYDEDGAGIVLDYLLNVDLTGFNPRARAMDTAGKTAMIEAGMGDLAAWVRSLLRDPGDRLVWQGFPIEKDIFTGRELLLLYDPQGFKRVTAGGITRELARCRVAPLLQGRRVKTLEGNDRVYAIRNEAMWRLAKDYQVSEHVRSKRIGDTSKL